MSGHLGRRIVNAVALAGTIAVNTLAVTLPLNGKDTGAISDQFPIKFVPAGYVFSIWSVIYVGLIAFAVYGLLPKQRDNPWIERIGWLFVASCVLNGAWLFSWHYEQFWLSVGLMLGLLGSLIAIYRRLEVGQAPKSAADTWLVRVPFSLYLGWITVATIANVSTTLYWAGWRGGPLSDSAWAIALLGVGLVLTALIAWRHRDLGYSAVIVWAFFGIQVKQTGSVSTAALIAAGLALVLCGVAVARRIQWRRPQLSA